MTSADLITVVTRKLRSQASLFDADDFSDAVNSALRETGWALPTTSNFQIHWLDERTRRHLFFLLKTDSAHKFKFEGFSLNQRFEHYEKIIKGMDDDFNAIKDENPAEFAGAEAYKMFGDRIVPGFVYDDIGRDCTYEDEDYVDPESAT